MRLVIITPEVREDIRAALELAREFPRSAEFLKQNHVPSAPDELALKDRPKGIQIAPGVGLQLPNGFRVAISYEDQPEIGLCKHISVSVDARGALPNFYAMREICKEFGMNFPPQGAGHMWREEYEPGCWAINVVEAVTQ